MLVRALITCKEHISVDFSLMCKVTSFIHALTFFKVINQGQIYYGDGVTLTNDYSGSGALCMSSKPLRSKYFYTYIKQNIIPVFGHIA